MQFSKPLQLLREAAPSLELVLTNTGSCPANDSNLEARRDTTFVEMSDGTRLATDLYMPAVTPAPVIAMRTPYGRAADKFQSVFTYLVRQGYVVVSQDCRGTGDSEPDTWDYYMYESEDGYDFVDWITRQHWFNGFIGTCGGSYSGQTQWCMAMHPCTSTIVPEVSGLGIAASTVHLYMSVNAYARSTGKGKGKLPIHYSELERLMVDETMAGGYFNDPLSPPFSDAILGQYPELNQMLARQAKRWLWAKYCTMSSSERAQFVRRALGIEFVTIAAVESLNRVFGCQIAHDAHTLPHVEETELCKMLKAPPLMITGWFDWGLNDAFATWRLLREQSQESIRTRTRLIITPGAHNTPGYSEGVYGHPELQHSHRTENHVELLAAWYTAIRQGTVAEWPDVIFYLMGANVWCASADWPPPEAKLITLYVRAGGALSAQAEQLPSKPDSYTYRPDDPTPTIGGSIVSAVLRPGSVDVSSIQQRPDVLSFTTEPLEKDLDVTGPVRLILYASSSARDTDFSARLSDVFPDGRALQIQSGILRARHRVLPEEPELLEPGRIYRLEIDLWATANRFKAGHRVRLDISSADFPRFDRNTNRGGEPGPPISAVQTIYHDPQRPSHLLVWVLEGHVLTC